MMLGRLLWRPAVAPETRDEILRGLRAGVKTIAPKYFYDDRGARLFEQICEQPEYYLTRTELEILRAHAPEIGALAGPRCALVEYGSGAGVKIRLLLDALQQPASYTPVDISHRQLADVAATLGRDYPQVPIRPVCADYTRPLDIPPLPVRARRVGFFPGSSIGNFHPPEAIAFLTRVRQTLGRDGAMILGVDRRKDVPALHAAYNDALGVTADFNLNVLARLNRELGADFELSRWRHRAFFNGDASRIEMHLESLASQRVTIAGERISFESGETIWTESSYKYDDAALKVLVTAAGFDLARMWTDAQNRFWVTFLTVRTE
ncbi:MAG TPA: L-histidine N(alpha)-methyltransferase [Gemmatimonadaceae bacterium]|nr:L-histidine N(alpha)-methyltransferase [Gemmatimonadaceae bacterium]